MKKMYKNIFMIVFLFIGLLGTAKANENFVSTKPPTQTAFVEEKDFRFEEEMISAPMLSYLTQATAYAMLKSMVDVIQEKRIETACLRGTAIIIVCTLSISLLIGFGSGLFAYLIAGNQKPDFIISLIRIIHQTDGKKRKAYSL